LHNTKGVFVMVDISAQVNRLIEWILPHLPKIIIALVVLVVGWWIIAILVSISGHAMRGLEVSLRKFLKSLLGIALKILLLITVASMIGIEMTSFIAVLAAAGFAVGLALQGSLGNFAGGILILLFKPFKVDDVIEAQGFLGKVNEIQIFNTILKTPDNKTVIIPNGALSNGSITNYSTEEQRRVDMVFGIGYNDDIKKAKAVLQKIVEADERVLKEPAPAIKVKELGDSSVNLACRVWVKGSDYWDVFFDMQETVKLTFDKNKISIPFPQRDVHMKK